MYEKIENIKINLYNQFQMMGVGSQKLKWNVHYDE